MNNVNNLNPVDFFKKIEEYPDSVLVDCRTKAEIEHSRLDFDLHLDLTDNSIINVINSLDKTKPYFIYCRTGARSFYLGDYMSKLGFDKIFNLYDGILSVNREKVIFNKN